MKSSKTALKPRRTREMYETAQAGLVAVLLAALFVAVIKLMAGE